MPRIALLLLVCLPVACSRSDAEAIAQPAEHFVDRSLPAGTLDTAEVRDYANIVEARLRLRPDRRFLIALADVHELATGKRVSPEIAFDGGRWKITAAGRDLGSLPEIPTFADGLELLTRLARTLGAKGVTAADAATVARINLVALDELGLADPLRARGLALLAIARASGATNTDASARMLARAFGYDAEAGDVPEPAAEQEVVVSRILPKDIVQSYNDAQRASDWYETYDQAVNHLGSRNAANEFVRDLEPSSPIETQARDWFAFAVAATYEGGGEVKPRQALARTTSIGGASRAWLLNSYATALGSYDRDLRQAVLELFPQLDTRPAQMYEAGLIAHRILTDPVRRNRYLAAALERSRSISDEGTRAWSYALLGDAVRLREIAESNDASPANRAVALSELGELPEADHSYVTRKFEALLRETYEGVYPTFAGYVNERRDWVVKERAARQWLAHPTSDTTPIEIAYYASSLADALEQQGRHDEAWKVVEPHVEVWSANIISGAMSLLDRRGRTKDAIELGKEYIERYHGASERTDLARIYWRRGRFAEAAQLFRPDQRLAVNDLRNEVPKAFVDTFRQGTPAQAAAALDALAAAGVDTWVLSDVITTAGEAKLHEHVVTMVETLGKRGDWHAGTPHGSDAIIQGWVARRALDGVGAATEWLGPRVPDSAASQFVSIAYQDSQHELVLAYATPRLDRLKSIEMLTFLAAAMTHAHVAANDPRRMALVETVRAHGDQPKTLLPVAQYLLDLMDEETFLRWPYQPQGRTVAAYFVGLKAASRGEYDKALPWFLAAAQGEETSPPRAWAIETLARWNAAKMSWKEIARAGLL